VNSFLQYLFDLLLQALPVRIVMPWEGGVRTWFGKCGKTIGPGIYLVLPFLTDIHKMDVNEQCPDMRCITALTSDNHDVAISPAMSYEITDVGKLYVNVRDLDVSLQTLVLAKIHEYINSHTYDQCCHADAVLKDVRKSVRDHISNRQWGIKVLRIWLTDTGSRYTRIIGDTSYVPVPEDD